MLHISLIMALSIHSFYTSICLFPAEPEQDLIMVLQGSAAVYGQQLPEPVYFYELSESSNAQRSEQKSSECGETQRGRGLPVNTLSIITAQREHIAIRKYLLVAAILYNTHLPDYLINILYLNYLQVYDLLLLIQVNN